MDNLKKLGDKSFSHPTIFWLSPNFCPYLWIFGKVALFDKVWENPLYLVFFVTIFPVMEKILVKFKKMCQMVDSKWECPK